TGFPPVVSRSVSGSAGNVKPAPLSDAAETRYHPFCLTRILTVANEAIDAYLDCAPESPGTTRTAAAARPTRVFLTAPTVAGTERRFQAFPTESVQLRRGIAQERPGVPDVQVADRGLALQHRVAERRRRIGEQEL